MHEPENEPQQLEDYFLGNVALCMVKMFTKVYRNGGFLHFLDTQYFVIHTIFHPSYLPEDQLMPCSFKQMK